MEHDQEHAEDVLITTGINSVVINDSTEEREGHVLLADYDEDMSQQDVIDDVKKHLQGVVVLCRSSTGSYHVYNPHLRSVQHTVRRLRKLQSDTKHVEIGLKRGKWTLRADAKHRPSTGRVYKASPEFLGVYWVPSDAEEQNAINPVSKAHLRAIKQFIGGVGVNLGLFARTHGVTVIENVVAPVEAYYTVTDEFKQGDGRDN